MPTWDPDQYLQFNRERLRPVRDLVAQIELDKPERIVDLGCGTGSSTGVLAERWPDTRIEGVDLSAEMLARAKEDLPEVSWSLCDLNEWAPDCKYDLIFSNAAFQWIPAMDVLLQRCMKALKPGGALAFQVPYNWDSPYHLCILEVAALPQWKEKTRHALRPLCYHPIRYYYDLLAEDGHRINAWECCYHQIVKNAEAIVEWVSGTGLRPYLQALDTDEERLAFKADLLERYQDSFPACKNGKVIFPFKRQFVIVYAK